PTSRCCVQSVLRSCLRVSPKCLFTTRTPSRPTCPVSTSPATSHTRATSNKPSKSHAASSHSSLNPCALRSNLHRRGLKLRFGKLNERCDARKRHLRHARTLIARRRLPDERVPSCGQIFKRPLRSLLF